MGEATRLRNDHWKLNILPGLDETVKEKLLDKAAELDIVEASESLVRNLGQGVQVM